ncbi:hypothetical protein Pmar_PMAR026461 [Perkinsus marinus ATCC 50983]|uniref:Uncharacterized protein n=1 Tax=Perkinsus marinus (strain ATCC 50983 / TXsc) TaxID=423536 RepID=C5L5N0_PERM5|nr:hypothetical protein Pmar_PMAR026461 [Perkinsus marinus ATCC 50983]EER07964.1 hypothetical protein Pmar_PMAR026461 [Perkinsus marinus ATCC 50983]|eukprot:XP_002776148.1 hypothetical protein Pmar_PMAR026461 [Perkinsus marinus ATCC 50983]
MIEGMELRVESVARELDEFERRDGALINTLEKQVEKARRDKLRLEKAQAHKKRIERRLIAAYERMEKPDEKSKPAKPIRFRSVPTDATQKRRQTAEEIRKQALKEYTELLGIDAAEYEIQEERQ